MKKTKYMERQRKKISNGNGKEGFNGGDFAKTISH